MDILSGERRMDATTILRNELVRRGGPTKRNVDVVGMKEVKTEIAREDLDAWRRVTPVSSGHNNWKRRCGRCPAWISTTAKTL